MAGVTFSCATVLDQHGIFRIADLEWHENRWSRWHISEEVRSKIEVDRFVVPALPLDIHCHGIGPFDFSEIYAAELENADAVARQRGIRLVATVFLQPDRFDRFIKFAEAFAILRWQKRLTNIVGLGLEGPLLSSPGGTPHRSVWRPTKAQWRRLAACGQHGLIYVVLSPDVHEFEINRDTNENPHVLWIAETLASAGVRPSLGHFSQLDPKRSAATIWRMIEHVGTVVGPLARDSIITDHLFNDMPRSFQHAWRTVAERRNRQREVRDLDSTEWGWNGLEHQLGIVPATLMHAARQGQITLGLNFDGEHVDPVVCKKTLALVGADRVMAMTDSTELGILAGDKLFEREASTLRYQFNGVVAAGSQDMISQIRNMKSYELSDSQIWSTSAFVPSRIVNDGYLSSIETPPECAVLYDSMKAELAILYHAK